MKTILKLSIVIASMITSNTYAQNYPKALLIDSDSIISITPEQLKWINLELETSDFLLKTNTILYIENTELSKSLKVCESTISLVNEKSISLEQSLSNSEEYKSILLSENKSLRNKSTITKIVGGIAIVLSFLIGNAI